MGRTGARGRGALWRWGPNHSIRVIVTRWRKYRENMKQYVQQRYMYVEGRRMLEFLACKDSLYGEWKLPGVIKADFRVFYNCFAGIKQLCNF